MTYGKMIVGVDGSETAEKALRFAARLADSQGAALTVVHAHGGGDPESVLAKAKAAATEEGVEAEVRGVKGEPAQAIIQTAESESADLIVVGNKGMSGVRRFMLGNVPNKVSHHSPCDLLIVKTS